MTSSPIQIIEGKCTSCGTCIARCPACFTALDGRPAVKDDAERCIGCGHCVALCPAEAVLHEAYPPDALPPLAPLTGTPADFERLVQGRRSHRHFGDKSIDDSVLSRILAIARFCPTGVHARPVCVKVIRRADRIRALSGLAVGYFARLTAGLEAQSASLARSNACLPLELERAVKQNARYRNMQKSFDKGFDPIFHKAPAVFIFHASKNAPTPGDDCIIAAQTAVLAAEALSLGTCYIGLFNRAFRNDEALRKSLALPGDHEVFATVVLGYPALKFLRMPDRAPLITTWE